MHTTDTSVVLRPRSPWESLDLGTLMARRHRRVLTLTWMAASLPVLAALTYWLWESPSLALLVFWWLKPAFEGLSLYILAQAVFGQAPGVAATLRQWPRLFARQVLPGLLWRRLSPRRSFILPVDQLEHLPKTQRRARLQALCRGSGAIAGGLTVVGMHLEMALWLGALALMYLLLPQPLVDRISPEQWLGALQGDPVWLGHVCNVLYAAVLVFWGPIYVACGFSLYLNRRTELEAWDIERVFRGLRQRLGGVACLVLVALLSIPGGSAWAELPPPDSQRPRLLQQALSSQAAQQAAGDIVARPPFRNVEHVQGWRFGDAEPASAASAAQPWDLEWLGVALEFLLWAALAAGLARLAWHWRPHLRRLLDRAHRATAPAAPRPTHVAGLDIRPQHLPHDIAEHAQQLWAEQPRAALALLYRGMLSRLVLQHRLPLKDADTEGQILEQVIALRQPALLNYSQRLTAQWQDLAYGHRAPSAQTFSQLCDGWRALFDSDAPR